MSNCVTVLIRVEHDLFSSYLYFCWNRGSQRRFLGRTNNINFIQIYYFFTRSCIFYHLWDEIAAGRCIWLLSSSMVLTKSEKLSAFFALHLLPMQRQMTWSREMFLLEFICGRPQRNTRADCSVRREWVLVWSARTNDRPKKPWPWAASADNKFSFIPAALKSWCSN